MPTPRQQTREQELWDAILGAELTPADFRVYVTLLKLADFGTAEIPDRFQPRSLIKLAERCHVSLATVKRSVGHLQRHGWLERHRNITESGIGGRGHPTRYKLLLGQDCTCKGAQIEPVPSKKQAQFEPRNRLTGADVSAGRRPVVAERAVRGEEVMGEYLGGPVSWETGWPSNSIGDEVNEGGWSA
jgi:predicted transcriptional regulator